MQKVVWTVWIVEYFLDDKWCADWLHVYHSRSEVRSAAADQRKAGRKVRVAKYFRGYC